MCAAGVTRKTAVWHVLESPLVLEHTVISLDSGGIRSRYSFDQRHDANKSRPPSFSRLGVVVMAVSRWVQSEISSHVRAAVRSSLKGELERRTRLLLTHGEDDSGQQLTGLDPSIAAC